MSSTLATSPFTLRDAVAMATIIADLGAHVAFSTDGGVTLQEGTVRRIGDQAGNSLPNTDVRDQFIWITTTTGSELFLPIRQVMEMVRDLLFQPFTPRTTR